MALTLDTRIPLLAVDPNFAPSKAINAGIDSVLNQRSKELSNRLEQVKAEYEERKAKRTAQAAAQLDAWIKATQAGTPAVMGQPTPATPDQYGFGGTDPRAESTAGAGLSIADMLTGRIDPQHPLSLLTQQPTVTPGKPAIPAREITPAVPGRVPTPLETMKAYGDILMRNGDPAGGLAQLKEYFDSTKMTGVHDSDQGIFGYTADGRVIDLGRNKKPVTATAVHGDRIVTTVDGVPTNIAELPQTAEQKRKAALDEKRMALQEKRLDAVLAAVAAKASGGGATGALIQQRSQNVLSQAGQIIMDLKNIANGDVSQQLTAAQDATNKGGSAWSAFTNNIARKLTPEEATTYAASAAGLDLALATMMNMGYKPTQTQIDGMHKITAVTAADTKQTAVYKMLLAAQHAKEILKRMKIGTPEQLQGFKDAVSELEASYPNPLDWQKATVPGFGKNSTQKYMQEQMARSEQISKELEKSAMGLTKPVSPSAPTPTPTPVAQTEFNKDWVAHPGAEDRKRMREYAMANNLKVPGDK